MNVNFWISFITIGAVGTLLHFLYEFSHHNKFVALFAAVNESVWEHVKIALTPTFLWGLVDGFQYGENPNYFIAKALSVLSIIILIPTIFYGYTCFTKKAFLPIDICSFIVTIFASQLIFYTVIELPALPFIYHYVGATLLFIMFGFYMVATLQPLKNRVFMDPITHKYGKQGHSHEHEHGHDHKHKH